MSRMRDPLGDPGGEDPIDDPPPPAGEEPTSEPGAGYVVDTTAAAAHPIPIVYGTRKVNAILLEKAAPTLGAPARRAASTAYIEGQYVTVLAYVVSGASAQDAVFRCTTSGTTSGSADFSSASLISIGDIYGPDGGCYWECVALGAIEMNTQSMLVAICEGEITGAIQSWFDKERVNALSLTSPGRTLTLQVGADALSNAVPSPFDTEIDYQHTAIAYGTAIPTGKKKEVPALAFEIKGVMFGVTPGHDVNPGDIINDLLTHSRRGCEWSSGKVDTSITGTAAGGYRVYCDAAGLRLSALLDTQRPAAAWIADILAATNSDALWSQGKIKVVPLGDQAIASPVFGATGYVPANTSQFTLVTNDFLDLDEPVQMSRRSPADCFNSWPIEYVHGASGSYQLTTVEDPDQSDVDVRGLWRAPTLALPFSFPSGAAPVMLSRIYAQRSLAVRNSYRFRLSWRYVGLEPTDIVTLTDPELGLSATPVRLTSITEDEEGDFLCEAEDYPAAVQAATAYTPQVGDGYQSNDRSTAATLAVSVDGATMGMGVAVVTAAAVAAACLPDSSGTRMNFTNLWPNPTSEVPPPSGADVRYPVYSYNALTGFVLTQGSPEWYGRTFVAAAWAASHAYVVGDGVTNGGNGYVCITAGTSAGSGGPTGTSSNITDGTVHWAFATTGAVTNSAGAYAGNYVRLVDYSATPNLYINFPVVPGESYILAARALVHSGAGPVGLQWLVRDASGTALAGTTTTTSSGAWTALSIATGALPAGSAWLTANLYPNAGTVGLFDAITLLLQNSTAQIAPSATDHQELITLSGVASWYSGAKKLLDATGSMLYASAANTLAKLGIGTAPQLLGISSGVPAWLGDTGWTAVSGGVGFQNSWVNYGAGYQDAKFLKDATGRVYVRGMIKNGSAINTIAFTLPAGYRPANAEIFAVTSNGAFGRVDIDASGNLTPVSGSTTWVSLDGISFDTA